MKQIHRLESKEASHIDYKPIIDCDPTDPSTIYTALMQCIHEEKSRIPVITFDLPIWMKSVDIFLVKNLQ